MENIKQNDINEDVKVKGQQFNAFETRSVTRSSTHSSVMYLNPLANHNPNTNKKKPINDNVCTMIDIGKNDDCNDSNDDVRKNADGNSNQSISYNVMGRVFVLPLP